jgi:hypothetical protein
MDESFWEEIERAKSISPEQKFLATFDLFLISRELVASGIRQELPDASEQEVESKIRDRYKLSREMELLF